MAKYTQLTLEQRYQIYTLLKAGFTQTYIANELTIHKSTVCRELRRNTGQRGYRAKQAQRLASNRRSNGVIRIQPFHWQEVERLLRAYWSPEQISCRLYEEQGYLISHEWIYQYIYSDKANGGSLYQYLRCQKKRKKRYGSYDRRGSIPDQTMIDKRPKAVENCDHIGDWEGVTVVGKNHKGVLVTLVERKSRYIVKGNAIAKRKDLVADEVIRRLRRHKSRCKTITYNNGREFTDHEKMAKSLKADIYFARPYCSWERGTNENTNGLIRQFFPKSQSLLKVNEVALKSTMNRLNHRPRKSLNWQTPHEVFFGEDRSMTVALMS